MTKVAYLGNKSLEGCGTKAEWKARGNLQQQQRYKGKVYCDKHAEPIADCVPNQKHFCKQGTLCGFNFSEISFNT